MKKTLTVFTTILTNNGNISICEQRTKSKTSITSTINEEARLNGQMQDARQ